MSTDEISASGSRLKKFENPALQISLYGFVNRYSSVFLKWEHADYLSQISKWNLTNHITLVILAMPI